MGYIAKKSINYEYKCFHCGKICDLVKVVEWSQKSIEESSDGKTVTTTQYSPEYCKEKVEEYFNGFSVESLEKELKNNEYGLYDSTCPQCGKSQPWSTTKYWIGATLIFLVLYCHENLVFLIFLANITF